jgi:predicted transposase/invertase (TIGR01784 family)
MMRESVIYQEILQEGEQRGEEKKAHEVAIKMFQENFELEVVARLTGLSIAELQALQTQTP